MPEGGYLLYNDIGRFNHLLYLFHTHFCLFCLRCIRPVLSDYCSACFYFLARLLPACLFTYFHAGLGVGHVPGEYRWPPKFFFSVLTLITPLNLILQLFGLPLVLPHLTPFAFHHYTLSLSLAHLPLSSEPQGGKKKTPSVV